MASGKLQELLEEFRAVVLGESNLLDTILPTIVFLVVNGTLGFRYAMWTSLLSALMVTVVRLRRRQPLQFALGGVLSVAFAISLTLVFGRAEAYFLPALLNGAIVFLVTLVSVIVRRPLVAWTSYLARRWPQGWYWHPRVRPAYSEVTLAWAAVFGLRLWLQVQLYRSQDPEAFALLTTLGGWPTTAVLLVATYLYGTWRLKHLHGPSVDEFKTGAAPPWRGQQQGF
jgi:hypothetical protein